MLRNDRLTIFGVLRLAVPVVRGSLSEFAAARALDSDAGRKITPAEWESLAMEIGLRIGEAILQKVKIDRDIIDLE